MIFFPNAKINLGLRILRKRPDGYHDLESAFLPVGLSDMLEIVQAGHGGQPDRLTVTGGLLETADDNLCLQAVRLLRRKHEFPRLNLHLHKCIPAGSGLGGGSSDAAFTLAAVNEMFGLDLGVPVLMDYAAQIGSDCPFFLVNRPVLASGRGELLEDMDLDLRGFTLLLLMPGITVNTAEAYRSIRPYEEGSSVKEVIRLGPEKWNGLLVNDFETAVGKKYPEIGRLKQGLFDAGAVYAAMTGSGSAVYGLFRDLPVLPAELARYPLYRERFT
jgi:4-diphosphocytidyl-2-C-methyl-D-erythritol kinase